MPGIVNVGGAHIKPPKPLPNDLQQFMDNSTNGVIVFTLGAYTHSVAMPKEKIEIFLKVFGKLKQNVLWKFEDESLSNVPPNVRIQKWLPQSDVLAHPNVVLFIAHGGSFDAPWFCYIFNLNLSFQECLAHMKALRVVYHSCLPLCLQIRSVNRRFLIDKSSFFYLYTYFGLLCVCN